MDILTQIMENASAFPDRPAIISDCGSVTWRGLYDGSRRLAEHISAACAPGSREPLIVCGHKSPYMVMSMLACAYAGHAYCPVDISMPAERVADIIDTVSPEVVLAAEESALELLPQDGSFFLMTPRMIAETADEMNCTGIAPASIGDHANIIPGVLRSSAAVDHTEPLRNEPVHDNETFYIIFTSGSTGKPKGVEITADNLNNYLDWILDVGCDRSEKSGKVFINQAPFSFDLSVMDLYQCLACGGTLYTLSHDTVNNYSQLIHSLSKSNASVWVSTPSFADVCLADPTFCADIMPQLSLFLFCGETLNVSTARRLYERFPSAVVVNTYGPTESTVAVTEVVITKEMCGSTSPLPVGRAKPGSFVFTEADEIIIAGNTVAKGYFHMPEKTSESFFETVIDGQRMRAYRTGDLGYIDADGMLRYCGRIDNQIKLHGYRIEIEDIENNLTAIEGIDKAAVIPVEKDGKLKSLTAYVTSASRPVSYMNASQNTSRAPGAPAYESITGKNITSKSIKDSLRLMLPDYMIPKKIIFVNEIPLTSNSKVDRKALKNALLRDNASTAQTSDKAVNGDIK